MHGSQIALLVGFLGATLVVLIGTNVGLIAGYYRGRTETILMRTVDVMYGIPFEPFALILVLLFQPSLTIVILAVSLLTWRTVARLIRSQVLSLRERPFVKAARVAGASDLRIMYLHIFPMCCRWCFWNWPSSSACRSLPKRRCLSLGLARRNPSAGAVSCMMRACRVRGGLRGGGICRRVFLS